MSETISIRASSLSSYTDCPRRSAARIFAIDVLNKGFELRQLERSVGAVTGTATHIGAAYTLRRKISEGNLGSMEMATELAMDDLSEGMQKGVIWDATTQTVDTAQKQVRAQISAFRIQIAPKLKPVSVEEGLTAQVRPGLMLTGHTDVDENDGIFDTKTGTVRRSNAGQYGAYSLLRRAHGFTVSTLTEGYIPRVSPKRAVETQLIPYSPAAAEQIAVATIKRMSDDLQKFRDGDLFAFLPNPQSMMCSDKYCPAWGTKFCRAHKDAGLTDPTS